MAKALSELAMTGGKLMALGVRVERSPVFAIQKHITLDKKKAKKWILDRNSRNTMLPHVFPSPNWDDFVEWPFQVPPGQFPNPMRALKPVVDKCIALATLVL